MSCPDEARFPNPCPICGSDDEHAWIGQPPFINTCPHEGARGHGTGCTCMGLSAERMRTAAEQGRLEWEASTFDWTLALGVGPVHDRTGTAVAAARVGGEGYRATLKVMTWTGCNGQRCARDCGPGHSVVLWIPCRFHVGNGHHYTVTDEEIASLREALGMLP